MGSDSKFVGAVSAKVACDVADEVERLYGFGICIVALATVSVSMLYIDTRFPTWQAAWEYARELRAGGAVRR